MPPALAGDRTCTILTAVGPDEASTFCLFGYAWFPGVRQSVRWIRRVFAIDVTLATCDPTGPLPTHRPKICSLLSAPNDTKGYTNTLIMSVVPANLLSPHEPSHAPVDTQFSSYPLLLRRVDVLSATTPAYASPSAAFSFSYLAAGLTVSIILGVTAASIGIILYIKHLRSERRATRMTTMQLASRGSAIATQHGNSVSKPSTRPSRAQQTILRHAVPCSQNRRGISWWDSPPKITVTVASPVVDAIPLPIPEPIPPRKYSDGAVLRPIVEEDEPIAVPAPCHPKPYDGLAQNQSEFDVATILARMRRSDTQSTLPFPAPDEALARTRTRPSSQAMVLRERQNSAASTATNASESSYWDMHSAASSASSLASRPSVESMVLESEAEMTSDGEILRVVEARRVQARNVSTKHISRQADVENMPPCPVPIKTVCSGSYWLQPLNQATVPTHRSSIVASYPSTNTIHTEGSSCPSINLEDFPPPPTPRQPLGLLRGELNVVRAI